MAEANTGCQGWMRGPRGLSQEKGAKGVIRGSTLKGENILKVDPRWPRATHEGRRPITREAKVPAPQDVRKSGRVATRFSHNLERPDY